ncbi:MAG: HupE/UreJ family protein [Bacteroidetes bacterium]|nr:HupE/UreJ family protein [Bacteroidota bacterium]
MGISHITDLKGIDHILFITVLCIRYTFQDWKKILVLVTAFTIGHSITLILSTLQIIQFPTALTEFFIALTILITALSNCYVKDFYFKKKYPVIYFFALFFGLIHGLGFSTLLKNMLGTDQNIAWQLLSFNLGIEAGQLIIVTCILTCTFIGLNILRFKRRDYMLFISGGIAALSIEMAIQRFPIILKKDNEKTVHVVCPDSNVGLT